MSDKFYLYTSRKGEVLLFPYTEEAWGAARELQDADNRMTLEEVYEQFGHDAVEGSYDEGYFYIDDGGEIRTIEVEDV